MEVEAISKLNPYELEAVLKWVDGYVLSRSSRKLCRDFSDGVLLAEILKLEFPKLVDVHNYTACNSVNGKIRNWDTLNRKVLKKLGIHLKHEEIEKLVKVEKHYIEGLLFDIMGKIKHIKASKELHLKGGGGDNKMSSDIMTITITKQVGDRLEYIPQQMIQYTIHEELLKNYEQSQNYVCELEEKIIDLENALQSKMQIIADMEERLQKYRKKSTQPISIHSIRESFANLF